MLGLQVHTLMASFFLDFCIAKISSIFSVKEKNSAEGYGTLKIRTGSDLKAALLPKH